MKKELVSIIVPVYNAKGYLERCIESLLKQTYSEIEILIIDDGSTDGSSEICDKYLQYSKVKVYHKINGGVSSARNYGLARAKGKWIFFVDSDDYVLENFVEYLKIEGKEDFVQGGCRVLDQSFPEIMSYKQIYEDFAKFWFHAPIGFVWSNCYKKDIIDKFSLKFDEDIAIGEDTRFNVEYLKHIKSIKRKQQLPYHHLDIPNSAVHKFYRNRLEIQKNECQLIEQYCHNRESIMRLRWYFWHITLEHYYLHLNFENKNMVKERIKETYKDLYFRESLKSIRKNGSLDEKIETRLMSYSLHRYFDVIMKILDWIDSV